MLRAVEGGGLSHTEHLLEAHPARLCSAESNERRELGMRLEASSPWKACTGGFVYAGPDLISMVILSVFWQEAQGASHLFLKMPLLIRGI